MSKKSLPIIIALLLVLAVGGYWYLNYSNDNASLATGQKVNFTVKNGMTTADIANMLHKLHLVNTPESFRMAAKLRGLDSALQAGDYEIISGMSNKDIVDILAKGEVRYATFTIPEGYTINQIAAKLEAEHLGSASAFKDAARNYTPYPYMETENKDVIYKAEGFAYPSTYYLTNGTSEKDILTVMVKEFNKRLTVQLQNDIKTTGKSIRDVVNLAAMVEKEAVFKDEMPLIAGVFLKRLNIYMPIQSDTTIQYILGRQKKELTIADTKISSPYNTYTNAGLPPGPIANPSIEAIEAVIHPVNTDFLYFVADKDGHHRFTKTYVDHLKMIEEINGKEQ
jgi:UPF0755 protein